MFRHHLFLLFLLPLLLPHHFPPLHFHSHHNQREWEGGQHLRSHCRIEAPGWSEHCFPSCVGYMKLSSGRSLIFWGISAASSVLIDEHYLDGSVARIAGVSGVFGVSGMVEMMEDAGLRIVAVAVAVAVADAEPAAGTVVGRVLDSK